MKNDMKSDDQNDDENDDENEHQNNNQNNNRLHAPPVAFLSLQKTCVLHEDKELSQGKGSSDAEHPFNTKCYNIIVFVVDSLSYERPSILF